VITRNYTRLLNPFLLIALELDQVQDGAQETLAMFVLKGDCEVHFREMDVDFVFVALGARIGDCDDGTVFVAAMENKFGVVVLEIGFPDAIIQHFLPN